ncbi:MAG TPA: hypothetical protein VFU49_06045, partial [Ktedonobacteraceae bacterium]|nr:hypothetical protein [Ktedonobacteraceae bacterium]
LATSYRPGSLRPIHCLDGYAHRSKGPFEAHSPLDEGHEFGVHIRYSLDIIPYCFIDKRVARASARPPPRPIHHPLPLPTLPLHCIMSNNQIRTGTRHVRRMW